MLPERMSSSVISASPRKAAACSGVRFSASWEGGRRSAGPGGVQGSRVIYCRLTVVFLVKVIVIEQCVCGVVTAALCD